MQFSNYHLGTWCLIPLNTSEVSSKTLYESETRWSKFVRLVAEKNTEENQWFSTIIWNTDYQIRFNLGKQSY